MKKEQLFLAAMKAEEYKRRAWITAAFSQILEGPDDWKANAYPYRIVQTTTGFFYVDPENENQLSQVEGVKAGEPLFRFKEPINLKSGDLPNLSKDVTTTYGNVLVNYITLVYPFGSKVPYIEGRISPGQLENLILPRLRDTPKEGETREDQFLYVDEYLKFADAVFSLAGLTQLCVPAATPKTMQEAPGIYELRDRLIEENKDRLHDQAVIAAIDAELVAYDRAYLKGDLAEGFLISKKSVEIVRKKQHGMHGAEVGLSESVDVDLIQNSLSEGWDIKKFAAMNNSLRAGSFNRGAQTMLGGASAKELARASSNLFIKEKDCGSTLGIPVNVDGDNYKQLVGFHLVGTNGPVSIDDEEVAKKYVGKSVVRRSPMFCKLNITDFCECCVGQRLAMNPSALSIAVSEFGATFLSIFMAAAHAKKLAVAPLDWKRRIT